ncbi:MAG: 2-methoxy-6-polyprenyl-1,4-benzoquinol methylase, mitochondrial [Candidatus Celerinatantimonas neptuna]|nr:MAG: 2-methoxy-6-polyprenyl-1,4-benzoquinol methylase, mitochondrial [Candidatus Celerinatantimonas neptuna]
MSHYFDQAASTWDANPMRIERAQKTAETIKKLPLSSRKSLLDFGGGTGLLSAFLKDWFEDIVIGDASGEMLNVAKKKISSAGINNIKTCQLKGLSELAGRFSAIATLMTLHHIMDISAFFCEAYEKLETNGSLIVADLYAEGGSYHSHHSGFEGHNGFEPEALINIAQQYGFRAQHVESYYEICKVQDDGSTVNYPLFFLAVQKI